MRRLVAGGPAGLSFPACALPPFNPPAGPLATAFTIITVPSNELISRIHDRMEFVAHVWSSHLTRLASLVGIISRRAAPVAPADMNHDARILDALDGLLRRTRGPWPAEHCLHFDCGELSSVVATAGSISATRVSKIGWFCGKALR
jgi:hypothetical protein